MSRLMRQSRFWRFGLLAAAGMGLAGMSCARRPGAPMGPLFRTPVDSVARDSIERYAQGLSYEQTFGTGDRQALLSGPCTPPTCPYATTARIEPVRGSHLIQKRDLAAGRIIGRIINEDNGRYDHVGVTPNDTTWWWVDYRAGHWRSVFISSDRSVAPVVRGTRIHEYPHGWRHSLARWVTRSTAEGWGTCYPNGCCSSTDRANATTAL